MVVVVTRQAALNGDAASGGHARRSSQDFFRPHARSEHRAPAHTLTQMAAPSREQQKDLIREVLREQAVASGGVASSPTTQPPASHANIRRCDLRHGRDAWAKVNDLEAYFNAQTRGRNSE